MYATLGQFCREIAEAPFACEFQAGENRLINAGVERCAQLWSRDGSAPKKELNHHCSAEDEAISRPFTTHRTVATRRIASP
jgi:hypothetical protein